jgi:hypothetical protein
LNETGNIINQVPREQFVSDDVIQVELLVEKDHNVVAA